MKLRIELLSDLCTYSGETYNSMVDTDVVYDDYGLPYIQAKRLKGCIREACQELEEFGVIKEGTTVEIFGKEGNHNSAFTLSNAYLKDYEKLCKALDEENNKVIKHPQNVLNLYTYARTQTAISLKTGVADENSLRTMRVIKKGLVFEADFFVSDKMTDKQKKALEAAIESVSHIGYNRSRGLGIVRLRVDEQNNDTIAAVSEDKIGERNKIFYSIELLSPMLCKSAQGNQASTQIYIEGGKVLGLLAGAMKQSDFLDLMKQELIVSNAYIGINGKRCTPLRTSLQKKKDQPFDSDNKMEVMDMLYVDETTEQMTAVRYPFVSDDGYIQGVDTEINYHHRRPEDKSVGKATGKDGSAFYQMESIRPGQTFYGYILADKKQTEEICKVVKGLKNLRMGYGRSSQYGAVKFAIDKIDILDSTEDENIVKDFQVKLNAPVIMFNENGMYAADIQTLESHLNTVLGVADIKITKPFLKYETIGGFNVTWKRRKPVFTALGMGTICQVYSETGIDIMKAQNLFIGERVSEGFGEIEILTEKKEEHEIYVLRKNDAIKVKDTKEKVYGTDIINKLEMAAARRSLEEAARHDADNCAEKLKNDKDIDATLSRIMMIFKEQDSCEKMEEQIAGITTDSKRKLAERIGQDIKCAVNNEYPGYRFKKTEIYEIYGDAYLKQMKYLLRPTKEERR